MGVALVLRDLATLLKGLGLIVLLWVRRDTAPAQGERLFSLAVLCIHCTAELLLHFMLTAWLLCCVHTVQLMTYFAFHSGKYQLYTVLKTLVVQSTNCTTILDN